MYRVCVQGRVCRVCVQGHVCRGVCRVCVQGCVQGRVCRVCIQEHVCSDVCVEECVHAGQLHGLAQTPGLRQACPYVLTASSSQGTGACLSLFQSRVHSSHSHSPGDTQLPPVCPAAVLPGLV